MLVIEESSWLGDWAHTSGHPVVSDTVEWRVIGIHDCGLTLPPATVVTLQPLLTHSCYPSHENGTFLFAFVGIYFPSS